MKRLIIFIFLVSFVAYSQEKKEFETIKNPNVVELSQVKKHFGKWQYFDEDLYIFHEDYVIYQNEKTYKKLYPDRASFHFPKRNYDNYFALDKNGVYYRGNFIKTDTAGFKILYSVRGKSVWKTKKNVYVNAREIKVYDVESFQKIKSYGYFKDKKYLYYLDKKLNLSQKPESYKEDYVYTYEGKMRKIDNEKLRRINGSLFKTSKKVFVEKYMDDFREVPIDVESIKALSNAYSMDKDFIYFRGEKITKRPKDTSKIKIWSQVNSIYLFDGKGLFYRGHKSDEKPLLDAKTFNMYPKSDFFYDKNGIYKRHYLKEKNKVINKKIPFHYTKLVSNKNTFLGKSSRYIVYENQVYDNYRNVLYEHLTKEQLNAIKFKRVFFKNTKSGVEVDEIDESYDYHRLMKSGNKIYCKKVETIADANSFKQLNFNFYKDKNRAYYYSYSPTELRVLKGVDVETLKFVNGFLQDKNYIYYDTTRLIKNTNAKLVAVFKGYRMGCSLDTTPMSNYYLFKNKKGYWLVKLSSESWVCYLGEKLTKEFHKDFRLF